MILLIIVGCVFTYCMLAGMTRNYVYPIQERRCSYRSDARVYSNLSGIFWPLVLPFFLGQAVANKSSGQRLSRTQRRHQRELAEADHKVELAKKNAKAVEIAERSVNIR